MINRADCPILYVDDEESNLTSFRYLLADRFLIRTASDSDEALKVLENEETAVLLADQRMESGMSGVELCTLARKRFPQVVRMLVTAYADVGTLRGGINDGQICACFTKPWREDEMVAKLNAAIDAHHAERTFRGAQLGLFKWDQQTVSSLVADHILRELCNPAAAIRDNLEFGVASLPEVRSALEDGSRIRKGRFREFERSLMDASTAAEAMVASMCSLRTADEAPFHTDGVTVLGHVAGMVVAMLRGEASKRATVSCDTVVPVQVAVEPFRVGRIVMGLLVDAVESITARNPANNQIAVSTFACARHGGVEVETGGPDVQTMPLSTIFNPFPANPEFRSRCLGLAVVRDLVQAARGEITVHATGQGTKISVRFPLAGAAIDT
jgi:CheY-like chemotaxis protein